eukprot:1342031-Rhodomonas_salina.2
MVFIPNPSAPAHPSEEEQVSPAHIKPRARLCSTLCTAKPFDFAGRECAAIYGGSGAASVFLFFVFFGAGGSGVEAVEPTFMEAMFSIYGREAVICGNARGINGGAKANYRGEPVVYEVEIDMCGVEIDKQGGEIDKQGGEIDKEGGEIDKEGGAKVTAVGGAGADPGAGVG